MNHAGTWPADNRRASDNGHDNLAQRLFAASPALVWAALALLLFSVPTLVLSWYDERTLLGVSVWLKPWKFQVATGTYLLTLAWVMLWLTPGQRSSRAGRYVTWVAIASAWFEVGYISWQAAWGRASHFNVATPYDATMYALMGVGAVLLTSTALVLGFEVLRGRSFGLSEGLRQATGWGLVLTFALGTGFGGYLSSQTGHWVAGTASDAHGMWLTTWSRSGGDLRVAHFFGIHAVHFLVAWIWLLERAWSWLAGSPPRSVSGIPPSLVWASGMAYSVFTLWTFWQAVGGRAFLS